MGKGVLDIESSAERTLVFLLWFSWALLCPLKISYMAYTILWSSIDTLRHSQRTWTKQFVVVTYKVEVAKAKSLTVGWSIRRIGEK